MCITAPNIKTATKDIEVFKVFYNGKTPFVGEMNVFDQYTLKTLRSQQLLTQFYGREREGNMTLGRVDTPPT